MITPGRQLLSGCGDPHSLFGTQGEPAGNFRSRSGGEHERSYVNSAPLRQDSRRTTVTEFRGILSGIPVPESSNGQKTFQIENECSC
jgi:hypothetical protein